MCSAVEGVPYVQKTRSTHQDLLLTTCNYPHQSYPTNTIVTTSDHSSCIYIHLLACFHLASKRIHTFQLLPGVIIPHALDGNKTLLSYEKKMLLRRIGSRVFIKFMTE
jgi:hypothetical protein